jgi:hypothetical protein
MAISSLSWIERGSDDEPGAGASVDASKPNATDAKCSLSRVHSDFLCVLVVPQIARYVRITDREGKGAMKVEDVGRLLPHFAWA